MKSVTFNWLKTGLGVLAALLFLEIGLRWLDLAVLKVWSASSARGREFYQVNPQIGWVLKPNLKTTWETRDGLEIPVETNSLGLRDREHPYQKPPGVYRILLLGDSFVEALQAPLADIFPTTLETCLSEQLGRPIEVINVGTTAYSIGDDYLYYLHEGKKYQPDLVLVSLFTEYTLLDLDRRADQAMVKITGTYRFDIAHNRLKKTWLSWATPNQPISEVDGFLRSHSRVYQILWHPDTKFHTAVEDLYERVAATLGLGQAVADKLAKSLPWNYYIFTDNFAQNPDTPPLTLDRWRTFQTVFQNFQADLINYGRPVAVIIIPNKYQAHRRFRDARILELANLYPDLGKIKWNLEEEPNRTFTQYFQQQKVPTLDLLPYFQKHDAQRGYSLYFDTDLHFNREGHYLTKDLICSWLIDSSLISP